MVPRRTIGVPIQRVEQLKPFRTAIEATGTYRWLYDLLSPRGLAWFRKQDFGPIENLVRDQLLSQLEHHAKHMALFDEQLEQARKDFPQTEALLDIYGIGVFSALVIIAELGEVKRFRTTKQVGVYAAGLIGWPTR